MFYFWTYLFISFVIWRLTYTLFIIPLGKKQLVLGPVLSSFLWPLTLVLSMLSVFGLFKKIVVDEEKNKE